MAWSARGLVVRAFFWDAKKQVLRSEAGGEAPWTAQLGGRSGWVLVLSHGDQLRMAHSLGDGEGGALVQAPVELAVRFDGALSLEAVHTAAPRGGTVRGIVPEDVVRRVRAFVKRRAARNGTVSVEDVQRLILADSIAAGPRDGQLDLFLATPTARQRKHRDAFVVRGPAPCPLHGSVRLSGPLEVLTGGKGRFVGMAAAERTQQLAASKLRLSSLDDELSLPLGAKSLPRMPDLLAVFAELVNRTLLRLEERHGRLVLWVPGRKVAVLEATARRISSTTGQAIEAVRELYFDVHNLCVAEYTGAFSGYRYLLARYVETRAQNCRSKLRLTVSQAWGVDLLYCWVAANVPELEPELRKPGVLEAAVGAVRKAMGLRTKVVGWQNGLSTGTADTLWWKVAVPFATAFRDATDGSFDSRLRGLWMDPDVVDPSNRVASLQLGKVSPELTVMMNEVGCVTPFALFAAMCLHGHTHHDLASAVGIDSAEALDMLCDTSLEHGLVSRKRRREDLREDLALYVAIGGQSYACLEHALLTGVARLSSWMGAHVAKGSTRASVAEILAGATKLDDLPAERVRMLAMAMGHQRDLSASPNNRHRKLDSEVVDRLAATRAL